MFNKHEKKRVLVSTENLFKWLSFLRQRDIEDTNWRGIYDNFYKVDEIDYDKFISNAEAEVII